MKRMKKSVGLLSISSLIAGSFGTMLLTSPTVSAAAGDGSLTVVH